MNLIPLTGLPHAVQVALRTFPRSLTAIAKGRARYRQNRGQMLARSRLYREKNREQVKVRKRAYYKEHHEEIKVKNRAYYIKNRDKVSVQNRTYREQNRDKIRTRRQAYYKQNRKRFDEKNREWAKRNPEEVRAIKRASDRRRCDKRHAYYRMRNYGLTPEKWAQLLREQGNACALCRELFTGKRSPSVDHDHETGRVRGLVHQSCHMRIGWYESLQRLGPDARDAIARYLGKEGAHEK